jgi:hypothetical protein
MPFYWKLLNNSTGEIVQNDYPFAIEKLARISAVSYAKRNNWDSNYKLDIFTKPFFISRQYKTNHNRKHNSRHLIIDVNKPRYGE